MERAVSPNGQRVGIGDEIVELPAIGIDPIDSLFLDGPFGRNGHTIMPALAEGTEDAQDVDPDNGLNNQVVAHVVPRLAVVDLAAAIGAERAANQRLQQLEQEDLRAIRNFLGLLIPGNAITVRHCWMVLKKLRENLPNEGTHRMPHGQDYARILERLAREITVPTRQDYECASCVHPLGYEPVLQVLEEMNPDFSCPLDYGECLDRLCEDMTAASSMMRVADGVYVIKDREQYARRLRSLAARVSRGF